MKKMLKSVNLLRAVVIIVICMFITSTIVLANNIKILEPGVLPDSPAYELKLKLEERELAVLNDPFEKAKLRLEMADLRLVEAMFMEEMGKPQFVNGLVKDYIENLTQVLLGLAEALSEERPGVDETLVEVSDATNKDIDILEGLLDLIKSGYIPEESQLAIELAINISQIVSNISIEVLVEIANGELEVLLANNNYNYNHNYNNNNNYNYNYNNNNNNNNEVDDNNNASNNNSNSYNNNYNNNNEAGGNNDSNNNNNNEVDDNNDPNNNNNNNEVGGNSDSNSSNNNNNNDNHKLK